MTKTPACPYCGETRQTEDDGRMAYCNTCGRIWRLDRPPTRPTPKGGL